jgi:hypothetical protein
MMLLVAVVAHAQSESTAEAVSIKIGDEIWVTFTEADERLTKPVVLTSPPDSGSVISIKLQRSGAMRTLYMTNGFARPLICRARIRFRGRAEQLEDEIGPIGADQETAMTFANPVEEISIFEFRLQ